LSLKKKFLNVVPGTKCSQKIFQKFFRSKIKVFGPVQIPKKIFFEFFSSISWGLCTGTKGEKVVIFGFGTGTKSEFRIFKGKNSNFSLLVPVLNPKSTTFWPLVPVQSPQEIGEKIQKKFFLGICTGPNTLFLDLKKF
jgi:hypothetical protein